jgi:uncharacterized DUF497 family protein
MTYHRGVDFEWDSDKELRSRRKHGIGFATAVRVFETEDQCLDIYDEEHSDTEERFITIGPVDDGLVLVVWTQREDDTIRVISARRATAKECDLYKRRMEKER